jgi:hypothetical protein
LPTNDSVGQRRPLRKFLSSRSTAAVAAAIRLRALRAGIGATGKCAAQLFLS